MRSLSSIVPLVISNVLTFGVSFALAFSLGVLAHVMKKNKSKPTTEEPDYVVMNPLYEVPVAEPQKSLEENDIAYEIVI